METGQTNRKSTAIQIFLLALLFHVPQSSSTIWFGILPSHTSTSLRLRRSLPCEQYDQKSMWCDQVQQTVASKITTDSQALEEHSPSAHSSELATSSAVVPGGPRSLRRQAM